MTLKYKLTIAFSVFIATYFVGLLDLYKKEYDKDQFTIQKIKTLLTKNCNCETVSINTYYKGIQFDSKGNFTTEKVEYTLNNCSYKSLNQEAQKINTVLKNNIENYKRFDCIELNFVSAQDHKSISINNGVVN
ncbi:conserved protein of unknown function [Tenacibaculum sp. 190130A14a]|uniref:Uncharacterized protein n=2 Tax=Tenacibaculum polynesiense TaxID=3137857 RepID=A0ABM9PBN0_9FLAO